MLVKDKVKNKGIEPDYYKKRAKVESSNHPNPKAQDNCPPGEICSAAGLYQFTKGTWKAIVKDLGLDYTLEDRFDPDKSKKVVEEFTRRNANYLRNKLGREPSENELYLAHFMGMGGAKKLLEARNTFPNLTVDKVVSQNSINSNPNVFKNKDGSLKKVEDIYRWSAEKFDLDYEEPEQDNAIYALNEENQVVAVNPEYATDYQKQTSDAVRKAYIDKLYPDENNSTLQKTNNNLTNFDNTTETLNFAGASDPVQEENEVEEIPEWKLALEKKQQERDFILSFVNQGGADFKAPEYKRVTPQMQQEQFQDGGQVPISKNGLYEYPKQSVIVPTKDGRITIKGIDYPVKGLADTGEEILMQPNKEYHFKGAKTVLEIPQL